MSAPPPPPPHGEAPKSTGGSGLPPGKYDIFVIPEHSAGAGFLYLPSLRPNINSFVAGFASALAMVALGNSMAPAFRAWWNNFQGMGSMGMVMLVIAVGLGAWSLGRTQNDTTPNGSPRNSPRGAGSSRAGMGGHGSPDGSQDHPGPDGFGSAPPPPPPRGASHAGQHPPNGGPPPPQPGSGPSDRPKSSWQEQQQQYQRANPPPPPPPQPGASRPDSSAKGTWEKARAETRRKEDERKAQEAEKKRRDEAAQRLREMREREARERIERERREREQKEQRDRDLRERLDRERREKEARERQEKEIREKVEKEHREREERERVQRARELQEQIERAAREIAEKEKRLKEAEEAERKRKAAAAAAVLAELDKGGTARKGSTYAFSAVGERTNPWPNGKPPAAAQSSPSTPAHATGRSAGAAGAAASTTATSTGDGASGRKPATNAKTGSSRLQAHAQDEEEEAYSFRPYDRPKPARNPHATRKKSVSDLSDTSWAPSQSTSRTTPPPSTRQQPYTTNDPDKIVIRGVYGFLNQFAKTPSSQLLSGVGSVTDGLILRITTEGLFIDDDVRGVPQREWDVKAWTLKLVEVWCPAHAIVLASSSSVEAAAAAAAAKSAATTSRWRKTATGGGRGEPRPLTDDLADEYLTDMLRECKGMCGLGLCDAAFCASAFPDDCGPACASASASASAFSASSPSTCSTNHSRDGCSPQTGEWKTKGLHLLRATVRDQEGKRFLFVLGQEEAWKVGVGLQRLRKGTQVRSLGVAGMSGAEVKTTLEVLGW